MNETVIIIPSRISAKRLPNKPLKLINNKEMILHVFDRAKSSVADNVFVATPDKVIFDLVNNYGGEAIMTKPNHMTGTDRVFEVFDKKLKKKPNIIINLQGDMPNIEPESINHLIDHMLNSKTKIGTLASEIKTNEIKDLNIVKVKTMEKLTQEHFVKANDFFRINEQLSFNNVYHHIGIYAFTNEALLRYVSLKRSKLEIERNLEQMRALEDKLNISVGYVKNYPLSVDTLEDLKKIKSLMEV